MGTKSLSIPWEKVDDNVAIVGNIAYISPSVPTLTVGQTYERALGTWNNSYQEGFRVDSDKLYYDYDRDLEINGKGTAAVECSAPNTTVFIAAFKNGVLIPGSEAYTLCKTANEPYAMAGSWYSTLLTKDDWIEVRTKVDVGTVTVEVVQLTLSHIKVL